jgi:hypothetical protein
MNVLSAFDHVLLWVLNKRTAVGSTVRLPPNSAAAPDAVRGNGFHLGSPLRKKFIEPSVEIAPALREAGP